MVEDADVLTRGVIVAPFVHTFILTPLPPQLYQLHDEVFKRFAKMMHMKECLDIMSATQLEKVQPECACILEG